ncbi:hypothetical protein BGZ47_005682 [Haplosporangium gracile]|nr:hypothetical protein BGZ47_005682 [Haplosporangium gracile]
MSSYGRVGSVATTRTPPQQESPMRSIDPGAIKSQLNKRRPSDLRSKPLTSAEVKARKKMNEEFRKAVEGANITPIQTPQTSVRLKRPSAKALPTTTSTASASAASSAQQQEEKKAKKSYKFTTKSGQVFEYKDVELIAADSEGTTMKDNGQWR